MSKESLLALLNALVAANAETAQKLLDAAVKWNGDDSKCPPAIKETLSDSRNGAKQLSVFGLLHGIFALDGELLEACYSNDARGVEQLTGFKLREKPQ